MNSSFLGYFRETKTYSKKRGKGKKGTQAKYWTRQISEEKNKYIYQPMYMLTIARGNKYTYVITTVLLPGTPPTTFTRAETGISAFAPTISIFIGFPSSCTLLYRWRALNASLLRTYTTSAEPCSHVNMMIKNTVNWDVTTIL